MRKALLAIALTLAGASAASAQGYLNHCSGEIYTGPVRRVRVERAQFAEVEGQLVEGPRRLVGTVVYSPDRRRAEHTSFDAEGRPSRIYVRVCYDDGKQAEYSVFDGERRLVWRESYSRDGREIVRFDADGRVLKREVVLLDAEGRKQVGRETYDGEGRLVSRAVNTRDDDKSVWAIYDGQGRLMKKDVHSLNYGGPHHSDYYTYKPDGTLASHSTSQADAAVGRIEKSGPRGRSSEEREYDAHRNLVRHTDYGPHPATGGMRPVAVSYHEITYF